MTLPRTVSDVIAEHVTVEVECIDRMYCNVYVPGLQYPAGLVAYVHRQLGLPVASTAPLARITEAFSAAVHRFAHEHELPWVDFVKGQRKDDVMHEHLAAVNAARCSCMTSSLRWPLAKSTHGTCCSRAKRCTAAPNPSVILAKGAVEAIGNPSCRCT